MDKFVKVVAGVLSFLILMMVLALALMITGWLWIGVGSVWSFIF